MIFIESDLVSLIVYTYYSIFGFSSILTFILGTSTYFRDYLDYTPSSIEYHNSAKSSTSYFSVFYYSSLDYYGVPKRRWSNSSSVNTQGY